MLVNCRVVARTRAWPADHGAAARLHDVLIEARHGADDGSVKKVHGQCGAPAWQFAMRDGFGRALGHARTLDELSGQRGVSAAMPDRHVPNRDGRGLRSPLDMAGERS